MTPAGVGLLLMTCFVKTKINCSDRQGTNCKFAPAGGNKDLIVAVFVD